MKAFTVKVSDELLAELKRQAGAAGMLPGSYARQLLTHALSGASELSAPRPGHRPAGAAELDVERLVRQAVWAVIVALSPDLDEEDAMKFVRTYLGKNATKLGFDSSGVE